MNAADVQIALLQCRRQLECMLDRILCFLCHIERPSNTFRTYELNTMNAVRVPYGVQLGNLRFPRIWGNTCVQVHSVAGSRRCVRTGFVSMLSKKQTPKRIPRKIFHFIIKYVLWLLCFVAAVVFTAVIEISHCQYSRNSRV